MSYNELKEKGYYYLENRQEYQGLEIEQSDMEILDGYKSKAIWCPLLTLGFLTGLKLLYSKLSGPTLFFENPLEPEERAIIRKKNVTRLFGNQMIFIGTLGAATFWYTRYEIGKYYLFLKYEKYVNAYVDARDAEMVKSFMKSENKVQQN